MFLPVPVAFLLGRSRDPRPKVFDGRHGRIRCPACGWEPARGDTWVCAPGCGHVWNTFETRGLCPGCSREWTRTACHRCGIWSPHDTWYEPAG